VAEQVGRFVNAYSGDLRDEALDGQRVVVGGIVTGVRNVITKKQDSMAIVTIEDLQGSVEVVVFPRLYETTRATWRDGAILLVAGRVDHKGEEVSLLADLAADWDDAVLRGPEAFAREVAAGDRSSGRNGGGQRRPSVAVGPGPVTVTGPGAPVMAGAAAAPADRPVSEAIGTLPPIRPSDPISTYVPSPGSVAVVSDDDDEPAVPDEARRRIIADASADVPVAAGPDTVLHVRFAGAAAPDRLVQAMEQVKSLLRDRPGATRVVIHVPAPGATGSLPMELRRGVAYDAELVAEVRRRLGEGLVDLRLASA